MNQDCFTILTLVAQDATGDSRYRFEWPAKSLAQKRPNWRVINLHCTAKERFTWTQEADLLILIQPGDSDLLPIVRERKQNGLKTVVELNDNFYDPPLWSPVAKHWGSPLLWETYERFLKEADVVMTTSQGLKNLFFNKHKINSIIVPNLFFHTIPEKTSIAKRKTSKPSIGWAGSLGHMADLVSLTPLLKSLSSTHEICLMGNKAIPDVVQIPNLKFTDWSSVEHYYSFFDPLWFGLVSIKDTPYNRCRSDIKPLELLSRGVVPLVQRSRTYESIIDKLGLPSFKSLEELPEIIHSLTNSEATRDEILTRGYEYISRHRTEQTNDERVVFYESLLSNKSPRSFPTSLEGGYHEIQGTPYPTTYTEMLAHTAKNERTLSSEFFEEYLKKCPDSPDARIIYLSILQPNDPTKFKQMLLAAHADFPNDLRFDLFLLDTMSAEEKKAHVLCIFEKIRNASEVTIRFWQEQIIKTCTRMNDIQVAQALLELYPNNATVLYHLAEISRLHGDYLAAHEFYERLKLLKAHYDPFLQNLDLAYLAAMSEGTE